MCNTKNSTNIYSVLRPILISSKFTFLAPFCVMYEGKIVYTFSIICNIAICVKCILMLRSVVKYCFTKGVNICNISQIALEIFLVLHLLTSYIFSYILYKKTAKKLHKLDVLYKSIILTPLKNLTSICSVPLSFVIISILITYFVDFITIINYCPFYLVPIYIYLELSSCIPGIQFAGILILIKYLFASLNTTIKNYFGSSFRISCRTTYQNMTIRIINHTSLLKQLFKTYNELCDAAETINLSYSILVLFSIVRLCVGTVHSVYYLLTRILFKNSVCDMASIPSYIMWLIQHMGMMFGFVYISKSTVLEVLNAIY